MAARLWIDIEDLFEHAASASRPSGVQRLAFELYRALQARDGDGGLVCFVRHGGGTDGGLRTVAWADVATLFVRLASAEPRRAAMPPAPTWRFMGSLLHRLPTATRVRLMEALRRQTAAWRSWRDLTAAVAGDARRLPARLARRRVAARARAEDHAAPTPGDWLLVLGAPWTHPGYAAWLRTQRERHRLRIAVLVYDLIPVRHPEWCSSRATRLFWDGFGEMLRQCDVVFAISRATAADVTDYAAERAITLPAPVLPVPIGSGFTAVAGGTPPAPAAGLPPAGRYALFVSTIEARKNHLLLFRVWQRLLAELPRERVPLLVFAGRVGSLVDDLMRQIANTNALDGHLLVIEDPTDAELTALYLGCAFTLFPSFYEGWGLPVTESLAFGKPCLVADRTSLPEAGGELVRRFDPDNLHDAYRAIREVIDDPESLARWAERVRREFRPVPWSATAEAIVAGLES